jgi:hypothetical protein
MTGQIFLIGSFIIGLGFVIYLANVIFWEVMNIDIN